MFYSPPVQAMTFVMPRNRGGPWSFVAVHDNVRPWGATETLSRPPGSPAPAIAPSHDRRPSPARRQCGPRFGRVRQLDYPTIVSARITLRNARSKCHHLKTCLSPTAVKLPLLSQSAPFSADAEFLCSTPFGINGLRTKWRSWLGSAESMCSTPCGINGLRTLRGLKSCCCSTCDAPFQAPSRENEETDGSEGNRSPEELRWKCRSILTARV